MLDFSGFVMYSMFCSLKIHYEIMWKMLLRQFSVLNITLLCAQSKHYSKGIIHRYGILMKKLKILLS